MSKLDSLASVGSGYQAGRIAAENNAKITAAFTNTLSRDGSGPNTMGADLDMNSNQILNLPTPFDPTDPVRLGDVEELVAAAVESLPAIYDPAIYDLSDVDRVNAILEANAGGVVYFKNPMTGTHNPNFLETGRCFIIPAGTSVIAVGDVTIYSDNPFRPVFHLGGDGAKLLGSFHCIGNYTRPNFSWLAGGYTTWATEWNAAHPDYAITDWMSKTFKNAWNDSNSHTQITSLGPLSGANRSACITSYDADSIIIDGTFITNFHIGITLQGTSVVATSAAQTDDMQTSNNRVVNITLDQFDFGLLYRKQRDFYANNISTEWIGHRVNKAQPHVIYATDQSENFEESWNVNIGTVYAYNYEGGCVVKTRGQKNFTWGSIICRSVHSALLIGEGTTGTGGSVLVEDQHTTTDDLGAGRSFAIAVVNSPGFVFDGIIRLQHRANDPDARGVEIENSDGVQFLQGIEIETSQPDASNYMNRVRSSVNVRSGPLKFTDHNNEGILLWSMSDSQDDGGNATSCVLEFSDISGTTRLAKFIGLSSNNQVWVDPSRVTDWDSTLALVNEGLGGGNILIDPRETAQKVLEVSASTDFSLKASNSLTIEREGIDPLDEDALPPPRVFSNNDTITIGPRTYTWKTTLTGAANEILVPGAAIVATYPLMGGVEYGYLQIGFLNAAIMGTTYKGAGAGAIYGTGTATNGQVESEWGGNQFNIRALAAGTGANSIACSVSMTGSYATWADGTTSDNLSGGGTADESFLNQPVHVTTAGATLTMTLPNSAPDGSFVPFSIVDQTGGVAIVQNSAGTRLGTLFKSNHPITFHYTDATGWRSEQEEAGIYDFNLNGGVSDGTTDNATAWANALATADEERLTIRFRAGTYYISQPPGTVVNATLHNCAEVTYDWISLEAVGGEVVFKSPELVTTASSAGLSRAILKANSSTGGTFRMKGIFAFDGGTPTTGSAATLADAQAQCPLEVRGYDLVEFDSIAFRNCRGHWDTRGDPGGAGYNASVEPTALGRRSPALFDDNTIVRGRIICETNAREGPFVTQGNVHRDIKFQYLGPSNPANAVSSPINPSGRFFRTGGGAIYGCDANDKSTRITVEKVSGAWRGSFGNVGWSGECTIEQLCPITGAVPSTGVDNLDTSTTAYGPGWDFGGEVNPDPSGPLYLNGVWMVNNHRYSLLMNRTVGVNEIELISGDIVVDGGWWGPRIGAVKSVALKVRTRDIVHYLASPTSATFYGSGMTIIDTDSGWVEVDMEGTLTKAGSAGDPTTRYSHYGIFKERSDGVRVSGRIKDFAFRLYHGDDDTGITDNARVHLFGPMEFTASTYTTATDSAKLVKIGRSAAGKVKRAELAGVRYNGLELLGQGAAGVYAYDIPGGSRLRLGGNFPALSNDRFSVLEFANDDASSPGAGVKARLFAVSDVNGRNGELYTEMIDRVAGDQMFQRPLIAHNLRNRGGTNYYCPKGYSIGAGTVAVVANTLYLIPYDEDILSSALSINITTGVAGNCRLGLYSSDRDGKEFALIEDLGAKSTAGTGTQDWAWAATYRRLGGPVWLAAVFDAAPTISTFTANSDLHVRHGSSSLVATGVRTHTTGSLTYGALPTTPPTMSWATANCPAIGVKGG